MGVSVLVVDDSDAVRSRLTDLLSAIDDVARVDEAAGFAAAQRRLAAHTPDMVVLDVRMPDGSGIELLRAIKAGVLPPVVVMLTNFPLAPYRAACLEAGADAFLDKSTEFERLAEIVAVLARRLREPA
ncbi:MAG: response regulator transcription factor [Acidobacteria bacterium]|nr:response regulator transcription factor [Acidobacteriota bacterium]